MVVGSLIIRLETEVFFRKNRMFDGGNCTYFTSKNSVYPLYSVVQ